MTYFYPTKPTLQKAETTAETYGEPQRLAITISLAEGGTGKFGKPIEAILDTGNDGCLLAPQSAIDELGLSPNITGEETFEQADGSLSTAPVYSLDLRVQTQSGQVVFMEVPVNVTEEGSMVLVGQGILSAFSYVVNGNNLTIFKLRDDVRGHLEPWTPQASKARKISAVLGQVIKDASIIEPLKPLKDIAPIPDLPKPLAPAAPEMPTMPEPPSPGKPLPKPK